MNGRHSEIDFQIIKVSVKPAAVHVEVHFVTARKSVYIGLSRRWSGRALPGRPAAAAKARFARLQAAVNFRQAGNSPIPLILLRNMRGS